GMGEGIEPHLYPVRKEDSFLLVSDGVQAIGTDTLERMTGFGPAPQVIVPRLLQLSKWCGGADNASAICVSSTRKEWTAVSSYGFDHWLEIWDSAGKIEFPIEELEQTSSPVPTKSAAVPPEVTPGVEIIRSKHP